MSAEPEPMRWGVVVVWALANAISAMLSTALVQSTRLVNTSKFSFVMVVVFFLGPPLLTAAAQWLVLRRLFARAAWWVLATALGFIAGVAAINPAFTFVSFRLVGEESGWGIFAGAIVCGIVAGIAQWLVLRRWVGHALWWVTASVVGWTAAVMLYLRMTRAMEAGFSRTVVAGAAGGALYGVATGFALTCLLRSRIVRRGFEVKMAGVHREDERLPPAAT